MHEPLLQERLETLEAITMSAQQGLLAVADRDLERMAAVSEERERLFTALRAVDRALSLCQGPVGDTPVGRAVRKRAEEILSQLVPTEETLRAALARWRDETGEELLGMRRTRQARRAYAASGQDR